MYHPIVIGVCVIILVLVISWLSNMTRPIGQQKQSNLPEQYLQESSKWSAIARNETNPILALVHINYALACANVAKDLSSEQYLTDIMGIEFQTYLQDCITLQDQTIRALGSTCPELKPHTKFAVTSGWI